MVRGGLSIGRLRGDRMKKPTKALLAAGPAAAVVGVASIVSAGAAGADTFTTVTPSTGLGNGSTVRIAVDSGLPLTMGLPDDAHVNLCAPTSAGTECVDIGTIPPDIQGSINAMEYGWVGSIELPMAVVFSSGNVAICHDQCFLRMVATFQLHPDQLQVGPDAPVMFVAPK